MACKGFLCGSNIVDGSITSEKLDQESIYEFLREWLEEQYKESWFIDIIKDLIREQSKEEWFQEVIRDVLDEDILRNKIKEIVKDFLEQFVSGNTDSEDYKWLEEWLKNLFGKLVDEDWFFDLICSLDCTGELPLFDVIPTDVTFPAEGGDATVQVIVNDEDEWTVTI